MSETKLAYFVGGPFDLTKMAVHEEKSKFVFFENTAGNIYEQIYTLSYANKMHGNNVLIYTYEGHNIYTHEGHNFIGQMK